MRKSVIAFVTLVFLCGITGMAHAAPRGKRFMYGMSSPSELADKVQAALDKDSSGTTLIDPVKCRAPGDGSCASARDYLDEIRHPDVDPHASVDGVPLTTVGQVPAFLRKLRKQKPPPGRYWMSCEIRTTSSPSGWAPLRDCVAREFDKGKNEMAYVDPDTSRVVLAEDCTNPVGRPEQEEGCVDIGAPSWVNDEIRLKLYNVPDSPCTGLRRAGETDFEAPDVERCYDPTCSFWGANAVMHTSKGRVGSFRNEVEGMNVVRLPASCAEEGSDCAVFFCRRLPSGKQTCGVGVRWFDYLPRKVPYIPRGDKLVAEIRYDEAAAGELTTRVGKPSRLWWNFNYADCR